MKMPAPTITVSAGLSRSRSLVYSMRCSTGRVRGSALLATAKATGSTNVQPNAITTAMM